MIKKTAIFTVLITLALSFNLALAHTGEHNFPTPDGYVTDAANLLSPNSENDLETRLRDFEARTSTEIAVVTVQDLNDQTIEEYTFELGTEWGVGKEDVDNGIVFLIAPNQRQARIEVGYGLEGAVPDITAYGILSQTVIPEFKQDNYEAGIINGTDDLIRASEDEEFAANLAGTRNSLPSVIFTTGFFIFFFFTWFASIFGRSKSWWAGGFFGAIGGIIGTIVNVSLWPAIPVLLIVGLLFDYYVSKNYKKNGKTAWWAGGGSGSGSSYSSSGSSFGGGSFGGGGSSGSW